MPRLIFPVVSLPLRPVHNTYAGREMVLSTSGRITVNASTPRLDPSNIHRHSLGRSSAQTGNGCRRISDRSRPDTCGLSSWNTWDAHAGPCRASAGTSTGAVPSPSASLRDTTRQWQPSRPSGFRKIAWPPTRKQNINPCMMHGLIFPVVSFPLRPVRVIRRPFPVVPCPIADCRLSAFARRPAAWNVLHPTWRGREGVLWRMGKAGTVWRRASQCAVS